MFKYWEVLVTLVLTKYQEPYNNLLFAFNSHKTLKVLILAPLSQIRKLRVREVKELAPGNTANCGKVEIETQAVELP